VISSSSIQQDAGSVAPGNTWDGAGSLHMAVRDTLQPSSSVPFAMSLPTHTQKNRGNQ